MKYIHVILHISCKISVQLVDCTRCASLSSNRNIIILWWLILNVNFCTKECSTFVFGQNINQVTKNWCSPQPYHTVILEVCTSAELKIVVCHRGHFLTHFSTWPSKICLVEQIYSNEKPLKNGNNDQLLMVNYFQHCFSIENRLHTYLTSTVKISWWPL